MCKVIVRGYACGHDTILKREPCFLVKNRFECGDEEKGQSKPSERECYTCRRQRRKFHKDATGSRHTSVRTKVDPATYTSVDAVTVIANLKALCAKVIAEQRAEERPKNETTGESSLEAKEGAQVASDANRHDDTFRDSKTAADRRSDLPGRSPARKGSFWEFADDKVDPLAGYFKFIASSGGRRFARRHREAAEREKRQAEFVGKTGSGNTETPPAPCLKDFDSKQKAADALETRRRKRSSATSTASVKSAKRRIHEMLTREFEQTASLGDIALESPEISPLKLDGEDDYDPAQSYLVFKKNTGYGQ
jgi:hypothetical protein